MSLLVEPSRRGGFRAALRAEWTKFRTVRGWMIGLVFAALMVVLFTFLQAHGKHTGYCTAPNPNSCVAGPNRCPSRQEYAIASARSVAPVDLQSPGRL